MAPLRAALDSWVVSEEEEHSVTNAVESARRGEIDEARDWILMNRGLSDGGKSRVVAALCDSNCRPEAALATALEVVGPGDTAWVSAKARRRILEAVVASLRRRRTVVDSLDDENVLLTCPFPVNDDNLALLPREDLPGGDGAAAITASAARLAAGAPRGRAQTDALACVAAGAYLFEDDSRRALDAALKTIAAGVGGDRATPAPVLRAVLREALARGDAEACTTLLLELDARAVEKNAGEPRATFQAATLEVLGAACADDGDHAGALRALESVNNESAIAAVERCAAHALRGAALARALLPDVNATDVAVTVRRVDEVLALDARHGVAPPPDELAEARFLVSVAEALRGGGAGRTTAIAAALDAAVGGSAQDRAALAVSAFRVAEVVATARAEPGLEPVAAKLFRRFVGDARPSALVADAALAACAAEADWRAALHIRAQHARAGDARRCGDTHIAYASLRACALAARPDACLALLADDDATCGPRAQLALGVAFALAGDAKSALEAYAKVQRPDAFASAAIVGALVSSDDRAGPAAAAKLVGLDEAALLKEKARICAALARRVGTARNWGSATKDFYKAVQKGTTFFDVLSNDDPSFPSIMAKGKINAALCRVNDEVAISEPAFARLAAALVRSSGLTVRGAIIVLTLHGIRIEASMDEYFNRGAKPRERGSQLYRALFGLTEAERSNKYNKKKQRREPRKPSSRSIKDPPPGAEVWYDTKPDRAPAPRAQPAQRRAASRSTVAEWVKSTPTSPKKEAQPIRKGAASRASDRRGRDDAERLS